MTQFDDILPLIGDHGFYQILVLLLISFTLIFPVFQTVSIVFTAGKIDFWCSSSNWTQGTNFSQQISQCDLNCSEWTFSTDGQFESSWRSQFGLVCSRAKLVNICSTVHMLGLLIGSTGYGIMSDRFGRLPAAACAVLNTLLASSAIAFSPNVEVYALLQLLTGLGASGITCVSVTFLSEVVTSRHRLVFVLIGTNGCNAGLCIISIIAYFIRSHWKLELVLACPAVVAVAIVLLLGESARWQLARNRPDDALATCTRIARINRKQLPPKLADDVKEVCETLVSQQGNQPHVTIFDLLKSRMRRPTLLIWNNFFSASMVYYGIILSTGNLKGNIFLIFLIGSLVGIPSSLFGMIFAKRFGRPILFSLVFAMSGICMLGIAFLWPDPRMETVIIILAITGRFFATASFDVSWAYSGELFPTVVRNTGIGSCSTAARIGGLLAPVVNILSDIWEPLPFLIFATFSLVTAALALLLPETKGARLPESLQDADKEYVKPKILTICNS